MNTTLKLSGLRQQHVTSMLINVFWNQSLLVRLTDTGILKALLLESRVQSCGSSSIFLWHSTHVSLHWSVVVTVKYYTLLICMQMYVWKPQLSGECWRGWIFLICASTMHIRPTFLYITWGRFFFFTVI